MHTHGVYGTPTVQTMCCSFRWSFSQLHMRLELKFIKIYSYLVYERKGKQPYPTEPLWTVIKTVSSGMTL